MGFELWCIEPADESTYVPLEAEIRSRVAAVEHPVGVVSGRTGAAAFTAEILVDFALSCFKIAIMFDAFAQGLENFSFDSATDTEVNELSRQLARCVTQALNRTCLVLSAFRPESDAFDKRVLEPAICSAGVHAGAA